MVKLSNISQKQQRLEKRICHTTFVFCPNPLIITQRMFYLVTVWKSPDHNVNHWTTKETKTVQRAWEFLHHWSEQTDRGEDSDDSTCTWTYLHDGRTLHVKLCWLRQELPEENVTKDVLCYNGCFKNVTKIKRFFLIYSYVKNTHFSFQSSQNTPKTANKG